MTKPYAQSILRVLTITALCFSGVNWLAAAGGAARTVEIVADKDNTFKVAGGQKGPLMLKAGEVINFKITSVFGGEKARDGAVHSFVVRNLRDKGWSVRLKEGVQEFTLTAPSAGKYLIECTVECGKGHDTMNMEMVVSK